MNQVVSILEQVVDTLKIIATVLTAIAAVGLKTVPGEVLKVGPAAAALLVTNRGMRLPFATREARIERFGPDTPMERYLIGASLMGFGSMLAGGCAVGAGMSGGGGGVEVDLIPSAAGSRLSLAAIRLLGVSLTDLPTVDIGHAGLDRSAPEVEPGDQRHQVLP